MARNSGQFQTGLSEPEFEHQYGTEAACREALFRWRWPHGFECPACGEQRHSEVKSRRLFQCTACRRQTWLIAGTIFAATKLPLRTWFRAISHLTQTKQGISSIELGRRLGVTQTAAWVVKHKLAQVMLERDADMQLTERVELDDAYLGGERPGGKRGRGSPGKTSFLAAVETSNEGKPVRLKLRRVTSFCGRAISGFAKQSLAPNCKVVSDGLACFAAVAEAAMRSSRPDRVPPRPARRPSSGSTPRLATSRPQSPGPTARSPRSMCPATLPSSNTASTGAMTSPPCCRA